MKVAILIVGIGLILLWQHLRKEAVASGRSGLNPEASIVISFDDEQVRVTYPNGEIRYVQWADLTMVRIRTTDEGPFMPDVFWGLHGADKAPAVVYPQGASGESELLEAMQKRLAGFDNEKVIQAMGCTSNAYFPAWEKG